MLKAYDIVVLPPASERFMTMCVWAESEDAATKEALHAYRFEPGRAYVIYCHPWDTSRSSDDWSPWFRVPAAES